MDIWPSLLGGALFLSDEFYRLVSAKAAEYQAFAGVEPGGLVFAKGAGRLPFSGVMAGIPAVDGGRCSWRAQAFGHLEGGVAAPLTWACRRSRRCVPRSSSC